MKKDEVLSILACILFGVIIYVGTGNVAYAMAAALFMAWLDWRIEAVAKANMVSTAVAWVLSPKGRTNDAEDATKR